MKPALKMPYRTEWANCYTKEYFNFGVRITSPTESNNKLLKSFILDGRSDLLLINQALEAMVTNMEIVYVQTIACDNFKQRTDWMGRKWLGDVPVTCSIAAIKKLSDAYREAFKYLPTMAYPFPPRKPQCLHGLRNQHGLPCWCEIYKNIEPTEEKPDIKLLQKSDLHP